METEMNSPTSERARRKLFKRYAHSVGPIATGTANRAACAGGGALAAAFSRRCPPRLHALGLDPELYIGLGAHHVAYLLCYLRVGALLHGHAAPARAGKTAAWNGAEKKWLGGAFAGKIRYQIIDREFA